MITHMAQIPLKQVQESTGAQKEMRQKLSQKLPLEGDVLIHRVQLAARLIAIENHQTIEMMVL